MRKEQIDASKTIELVQIIIKITVGKTYLVKDIFAEAYYKDRYVYVDFKRDDDIREFCERTANAEKIIEYLSLLKGRRITENTPLIFDEVQRSGKAAGASDLQALGYVWEKRGRAGAGTEGDGHKVLAYRQYLTSTGGTAVSCWRNVRAFGGIWFL